MAENKVYIDFEAISAPMSWMANSRSDEPFSFSMVNPYTRKCEAYVVDFNRIDNLQKHQIGACVDRQIKEAILSILKKWNIDNPEFVTWNGGLERKILKRIFQNVNTENQYRETKIHSASLAKMSRGYAEKEYFTFLKGKVGKKAYKKLNSEGMKKGKMTKESNYTEISSGAFASVIGAFLYARKFNPGVAKDILEIDDIDTILSELEEYSKDDTLRMLWINDNKNFCDGIYEEYFAFHSAKKRKTRILGDIGNIKQLLNQYKCSTIQEFLGIKDDIEEYDPFIQEQYGELIEELKEESKLEYHQKLVCKIILRHNISPNYSIEDLNKIALERRESLKCELDNFENSIQEKFAIFKK